MLFFLPCLFCSFPSFLLNHSCIHLSTLVYSVICLFILYCCDFLPSLSPSSLFSFSLPCSSFFLKSSLSFFLHLSPPSFHSFICSVALSCISLFVHSFILVSFSPNLSNHQSSPLDPNKQANYKKTL